MKTGRRERGRSGAVPAGLPAERTGPPGVGGCGRHFFRGRAAVCLAAGGAADDRGVVGLFVTDKGRRICADYYSLAGPYLSDAFDFVSPEDEPAIRRFFVDMIKQFGELIRKERGK